MKLKKHEKGRVFAVCLSVCLQFFHMENNFDLEHSGVVADILLANCKKTAHPPNTVSYQPFVPYPTVDTSMHANRTSFAKSSYYHVCHDDHDYHN